MQIELVEKDLVLHCSPWKDKCYFDWPPLFTEWNDIKTAVFQMHLEKSPHSDAWIFNVVLSTLLKFELVGFGGYVADFYEGHLDVIKFDMVLILLIPKW